MPKINYSTNPLDGFGSKAAEVLTQMKKYTDTEKEKQDGKNLSKILSGDFSPKDDATLSALERVLEVHYKTNPEKSRRSINSEDLDKKPAAKRKKRSGPSL